MAKEIVVLHAPKNFGKTSTVKAVCRYVSGFDGVTMTMDEGGLDRNGDIICKIAWGDKTCGFVSGGDSLNAVTKGLNFVNGCDVILCAVTQNRHRQRAKKIAIATYVANFAKQHQYNQNDIDVQQGQKFPATKAAELVFNWIE